MNRIASFLLIINKIALLSLVFFSCDTDDNPGPTQVITSFYPNSGLVGHSVTIYGNDFIPNLPPEEGSGPHINTSVVKFNGIMAEAEFLYQDTIGNQHINTVVPQGATSGKITVTTNGNTVSSLDDFIVTVPIYLPNVTVSTAVSNYGGWDVAIDGNGNLYVTNTDRFEIVKISPDGNIHTIWSSVDSAPEEMPLGITVDAEGNVFATVTNYVLKISSEGTPTILAGSLDYGYADGQGTSARFHFPFGIALDNEGNLFVTDMFNYKIRKITPDGMVSTIAGSSSGYADGQGTNAQFGSPIDVALDGAGNMYVVDGMIRKITSTGQVSTIVGTTPGYQDGSTDFAQFNGPSGIVLDAEGNMYITDTENFVVRRISAEGAVVTVAGSAFGNLDGPGPSALFGQTLGITMDANGAIFLTQGGGLGGIRKIVID